MNYLPMETSIDFMKYLEHDMALKILTHLDDPADIVRIGAVSHSWRNFVLKNRVSRQLCLKRFPQLSNTSHVIESNPGATRTADAETGNVSDETEILATDHKVYASLLQALSRSEASPRDCLAEAIAASSTDRPNGIVINILNPWRSTQLGSSYWSSKGHSDPNVPETLTYRIGSGVSIITEIDIQPARVYWERDHPISSAESVRFRMGHQRSKSLQSSHPDEFDFVWTYTSPVFHMQQENQLQQFKLPEPVLCVGRYLQIELLGRVEKAQIDGLYYICISKVRVMGLPLKPAFDVEILGPSGEFLLKYDTESMNSVLGHTSK